MMLTPEQIARPDVQRVIAEHAAAARTSDSRRRHLVLLIGEEAATAAIKAADGPGLLKRATSFVRSLVRHVRHGLPTVSEAEKQRRLTICRECEHFEPAGSRCRRCGCRMKLKSVMALEHCPLTPPKW